MAAPKYVPPQDALVADVLKLCDDNQLEAWSERAGIMEFSGGLRRGHSECLALIDTLRRWPSVLAGMTVLEVELGGATQWLLTLDLTQARRWAMHRGAVELAVLEPREVLRRQYRGVAMLTTLS